MSIGPPRSFHCWSRGFRLDTICQRGFLRNQGYKSVDELLALFLLLREAGSGLNTPVSGLVIHSFRQEEWASFLVSDHLNSLSLGAGSIGFQPWNVEFLWSPWQNYPNSHFSEEPHF